jgi:hypothetical protein
VIGVEFDDGDDDDIDPFGGTLVKEKELNPWTLLPLLLMSLFSTIVMTKEDHEEFLAHNWPPSISIYFVRTVCEFIRLKVPDRIHEETFLAFVVFFDGFDMMVTGDDLKIAYGIFEFLLKIFKFKTIGLSGSTNV